MDTYRLIGECVRKKKAKRSNEEIRTFLIDSGISHEMMLPTLMHVQTIHHKMKRGLTGMIGGLIVTIVSIALSVLSLAGGGGIGLVMYGAAAGRIGVAVSGYNDWRHTKLYR